MFSPDRPMLRWSNDTHAAISSRCSFVLSGPRWPPMSSGVTRPLRMSRSRSTFVDWSSSRRAISTAGSMWIARLQQFNAEDPADATRINAKRIEELIRRLEQRGARVLLFELPYAEPVEGSRFASDHAGDHSRPVSRSASMAADRCEPKRAALGRRRSPGRAVRRYRDAGPGALIGVGARGEVTGQALMRRLSLTHLALERPALAQRCGVIAVEQGRR